LLQRLQRVNPDDPQLRGFQTTGSYAGEHCKLPDVPPKRP
jgi:hypothetical protein